MKEVGRVVKKYCKENHPDLKLTKQNGFKRVQVIV